MKILVVSLMRMGDLIMQRSLLRAIQAKHPLSEIHIMINDLTNPVSPVIHEATKIHIFPRKALQGWMNNSESPLLQPYHYLNDFIKQVSANEYSIIYNFTHTKLSAYLMALIPAPEKHGLVADEFAYRPFENKWMHYFNERFTSRVDLHFHYIELLGASLGLNPIWPHLVSSVRNNTVLISVFSSDDKKNWNLSKFKQLKLQLESRYSSLRFKILCAHSEIEKLKEHFELSELIPANFAESEELLKNSHSLITIDSVMKHLAAECGNPILEISTGSSDPQRTGPLTSDAVIVVGQSKCYPCKHSYDCPETSFLCSDGISVQSVFLAFEQLVSNSKVTSNQFLTPNLNSDLGFLFGKKARSIQLTNKLVFNLYLNQTKINFRKQLAHPLLKEINQNLFETDCLEHLKLKNLSFQKLIIETTEILKELSGLNLSSNEILSQLIQNTKQKTEIAAETFNFVDSLESAQNIYEIEKALLNLQKDLSQFEKINLILMKQLRGEFYGRESQGIDQEQDLSS